MVGGELIIHDGGGSMVRQAHLLFLVLNSTACGGWWNDEDDSPETIARFESTDDGAKLSGGFTAWQECSLDPNTGILQARFSTGDQSLAVAIRDLPSDRSSMECSQAVSNYEDKRYIGDGFEGCTILVEGRSVRSNQKETFGLYRTGTKFGLFTTPGGCSLETERAGSTLQGKFNCEALVQYAINGLPRNPVANENLEPLATRSFSGEFRCGIEHRTATSPLPSSPLPPVVASGSLKVGEETVQLAYRSAASCAVDAETGSLHLSFDKGEEHTRITVRDFNRQSGVFHCQQAENNIADPGAIGDHFEHCGVQLQYFPRGRAKLNGFSMFRPDTTIKPFRHSGDCQLSLAEVDNFVRGEVNCQGMAQTRLNGVPRNPVATRDLNADVQGDLSLNFACGLEK
jgi:hypothetical protein